MEGKGVEFFTMSRALQELYSQFLCNNKMFSSVEEILRYRKLWPTSDMVEDMVKKVIGSVSTAKFHVGLDVSSSSTGICILSNESELFSANYDSRQRSFMQSNPSR